MTSEQQARRHFLNTCDRLRNLERQRLAIYRKADPAEIYRYEQDLRVTREIRKQSREELQAAVAISKATPPRLPVVRLRPRSAR